MPCEIVDKFNGVKQLQQFTNHVFRGVRTILNSLTHALLGEFFTQYRHMGKVRENIKTIASNAN